MCPQCNSRYTFTVRLFCSLNNDAYDEIHELQNMLKCETKKKNELIDDIRQLNEDKQNLKIRNKDMGSKMDEMWHENMNLQEKVWTLEKYTKQREKDLMEANDTITKLMTKMQQLEKDLKAANEANSKSTSKNGQLLQNGNIREENNYIQHMRDDDEGDMLRPIKTKRKLPAKNPKAKEVNDKMGEKLLKRRPLEQPVRSSSRIRAQKMKKDAELKK